MTLLTKLAGMLQEKLLANSLATMPYRNYLQTTTWKMKRAEALKKANYRCQCCNNPEQLEVHHRTYQRRGQEEMIDLTVLCKPCHILIHKHRRLVP